MWLHAGFHRKHIIEKIKIVVKMNKIFGFAAAVCCAAALLAGKKSADAPVNTIVSSGSGKMPWKIGVALYSFHHHPYETAVRMADSAGISYLEGFSFYNMGPAYNNRKMGNLDPAGIRLMVKDLAKRKLNMTSMYVENGTNEAEWENYFRLGAAAGVKYLVCEPAKAHWNLIDRLAGKYNIKVAIHNHARASAFWHPDSVLAAINGHANIGACADVGHWARSGLDPVACVKKLKGHILGLHIKDIDQLGNLGAADVNPGTGVIDYPALATELKRQGFKGYLQIECEHNMKNNLQEVKDAIQYIKGIYQKAGK